MILSLIVISYNRPQLLAKCLASLEAQTNPNWEALIADDNSSNPEVERMIRDFGTKYPGTIYYKSDVRDEDRAKTVRYGWLIEKMRPLARGEYAVFLTDDSELLPHAVDTILTELVAHPEWTSAYFNQYLVSADYQTGETLAPLKDVRWNVTYGHPLFQAFCAVDLSQVVVRKDVVLPWQLGGEHWHHAEGLAFDGMIQRYGPIQPLGDLTQPLAIYKITDTSMCRQDVNLALDKLKRNL